MEDVPDFDPLRFLPYLLNQAADTLGLEFQSIYRKRYGLLRTDWRVLFHLGCYGPMTAREICVRGRLHKTKVSRAVAALEAKRFAQREEVATDRRSATLFLTKAGDRVFRDLSREADAFNERIRMALPAGEADQLIATLRRLSGLDGTDQPRA